MVDLGTVSEDAVSIAPESLTVAGTDSVFTGRQFVGLGRLDTERQLPLEDRHMMTRDELLDIIRLGDDVVAGPPRHAGYGLIEAGAKALEAGVPGIDDVEPALSDQQLLDIAIGAHVAIAVSGRVGIVVPHGVLFRGGSEGLIRRRFIEENALSVKNLDI